MRENNFYISEIDEILSAELIAKNLWNEKCPVDLRNLRLLNLSYVNFSNIDKHDGEMIVSSLVAESVLNIFKQLYEYRFPINKIRLLNHYNGNDDLSMADNNTSCFNYRKILNSDKISMHSYGLAIDINPVQNPCITKIISGDNDNKMISPPSGKDFLDRNNLLPPMVENIIYGHKTIIDIFYEYEFVVWGGNWDNPKDYHHFQLERNKVYNACPDS